MSDRSKRLEAISKLQLCNETKEIAWLYDEYRSLEKKLEIAKEALNNIWTHSPVWTQNYNDEEALGLVCNTALKAMECGE